MNADPRMNVERRMNADARRTGTPKMKMKQIGANNDDEENECRDIKLQHSEPSSPYSATDIMCALEPRNRSHMECIIAGSAIPRPGMEQQVLLAGKVRAMMALQQPACSWVEQVLATHPNNNKSFRTWHVAYWKSTLAQEKFRSSKESQTWFEYLDMTVPSSYTACMYLRVQNPFHFSGHRITRGEKVETNPLDTNQSAVPVIIEAFPRRGRHDLFMKLVFASEALAILEEGCSRYLIMRQRNLPKVHRDRVTVYALFRNLDAFRFHCSQGYSLLGERFSEMCARPPVATTFFRNSIAMATPANETLSESDALSCVSPLESPNFADPQFQSTRLEHLRRVDDRI